MEITRGYMKALILFGILICFAGCGTLREMNSNMEKTNELLDENIVVLTESKGTIENNTAAVTHSTDEMQEFEGIVADNSAAINKVMDEVHAHSYVLSMGVIVLLALLFLPSLILVIFYFKFLRNMKSILRK